MPGSFLAPAALGGVGGEGFGVGRTHARPHILLPVQDLHIRIGDAASGELLRELTLDPGRNYQPTGKPRRPRGPRRRRSSPEP